MSDLYSPRNLKTIVEHLDSATQDEIQELITCFEFDYFLNNATNDPAQLRLYIIFLKKITKHDQFFKTKNPFRFTLYFLTEILDMDFSSEVLSHFLDLLNQIIKKTKDLKLFQTFYEKNKIILFEKILSCIRIDSFNNSHAGAFTEIILEMLLMNCNVGDDWYPIFSEIINKYMNLKVYYEISLLSEVIVAKYSLSSKIFKIFWYWLLKIGFKLLVETVAQSKHVLKFGAIVEFFREDHRLISRGENAVDSGHVKDLEFYGEFLMVRGKDIEELLATTLLRAMDCLYKKIINYTQTHSNSDVQYTRHTLSKLSKNAYIFVPFFIKPELKPYSTRLFAYTLLSEDLSYSMEQFYKKLLDLPDDLQEWVHHDPDVFLLVSYILCKNDWIMWQPEKMLTVIKSIVYSPRRYILKSDDLKILCYLFPCLIAHCINKNNVILGDDLLIIMSAHLTESENIFSLHTGQLNWILRRGNTDMRKTVIRFWLKSRESDIETIKMCILGSNTQNLLLQTVLEAVLTPNVSCEIVNKGKILLRSLNGSPFADKMAKILPGFYDNLPIFKTLMLANPEVPNDIKLAIKLGRFISLMFVITLDEETFGLVCDYAKNIVTFLKPEPRILDKFYHDHRNVMVVIKRMKTLGDEAAIKAMGFIRVLLLVQKQNNFVFDNPREFEIAHALDGPTAKIEKCLDALLVLITPRLLARLSRDSIYSVFVKLISVYNIPDVSDKSLECLTKILRRNSWLVRSAATNFFVEMQCSLDTPKNRHDFFAFLRAWIRALKRNWPSVKYVADLGIVQNYIRRGGPGLSLKKETLFLKSLSNLNQQSASSNPFEFI